MSFFGLGEKKPPRILQMDIKTEIPNKPALLPPHPEGKQATEAFDPDENKYKKKEVEKLPTWHALPILAFCVAVFLLVVVMDARLPEPLKLNDKAAVDSGHFIEERARIHLRNLTKIGPRPAGSYENEILAVDFLQRALSDIQTRINPIHRMTVDLQKPRGSFNLKFVDGLTHNYRDIQNVIVRLENGEKSGKDALLVNCHFDTVLQSPGASDDAVSCAIMLEILDVLVQSKEPLRHNLIFLFNGAEENMLQASHGFITQHLWASEIRAFINLEACGAGGRELVFQSGPGHPWMIETYGNVAPHPFASVIGQEIFQSGVIPGDTDFRIFRDYGNIPGLDIAYMKNGYVYHTKYDTEAAIPPGSIQRAGDNILAMVKHLAQADILSHTETAPQSGMVFFDVLGVFLIHYPEWIGVMLNAAVMLLSVSITIYKVRNSYLYGVTSQVYLSQLGRAFINQVLGLVASFVTVTIIGTMLDAFGRPMSWFARPILIFFLYMIPTVFSVIAVFHFVLPKQKKFFQFSSGGWAIEDIHFEVSKLVWTLFLLLMTLCGLKSSYYCTIWILFPMIGRLIINRVYDSNPAEKKQRGSRWLLIHLLSLLIPLIFHMKLMYSTFTMFIPVMGRIGSTVNPELLIGYKALGFTLATLSFVCPLVMVLNKPDKLLTVLYLTTFVTMLLVLLTSLGFPYAVKSGLIVPHRALAIHTYREFYRKSGELQFEDSGYFIVNVDRNSPKVLFHHVPEFYGLEEIGPEQCERQLFCGMPVYYPAQTMLSRNHWIPAKRPRLLTDVDLELLHKEPVADKPHTYRLLFRVSGPTHMGVYMSPTRGTSLENWSFEDGNILAGPEWKDGRPTYYVFYSRGLNPTAWEFWVELRATKTAMSTDPLLDISVVGHIMHGHDSKSTEFRAFLAQYPNWSFVTAWTASYKGFIF